MDYDDNYPSCRATYATLRIFRDDLDPDAVSSMLGIIPSDRHRKGDTLRYGSVAKSGAWFLSSKGQLESKDVQRHIMWILDQLTGKVGILHQLQDEGCSMDIFCYWLSASGQGGPTLSPELMRRLAEAELEIGFDVYC